MSAFLYTLIIYPLAQIIEFVFVFAQKLFKETGISIICVSGAISVLCLPLYMVAETWQEAERKIQKRLAAKTGKIKAVFKGDEQYMILSTYYRQNRYHPVYALRSTFGLLIQVPFFIAAYSYLAHLEALQGTKFLFIHNLGAPDGLLPVTIGGAVISLNLLPVIMTLINIGSGAIYTKNLTAKERVQLYGMALVFLVLLYNSPAGLVLYWTLNNVFSLIKNIYIKIPCSKKQYVLMAFFSLFCLFLAAFCTLRYNNNLRAQLLVILSLAAAVFPWIFARFKKQMLKLTYIQYEPGKALPVFLLSLFAIWSLLGLNIPSQLIVASPQEFSFIDNYTNPLYFIGNTALQSFGAFVFWPVCLYFLFSSGVKKYLSLAFLCACLMIIVNAFVFTGKYGIVSVNIVFSGSVNHSFKEIAVNLAVLLLPLGAAIFLYVQKNKKILLALLSFCVFSLTVISCINIFKINSEFSRLKQYYTKEQHDLDQLVPVCSLSRTGKNLVVIMLDRAISVFMPYIFDENPDLKGKYSGFIYYPNTVSFNGYTSIGAPPIFGGYEYTPEEINKRDQIPLVEKHNQSLLMMPRILSENGFSVYVTDPPYANYNQISDLSIYDNYDRVQACITDSVYTDLWVYEHNLKLPTASSIIKRNLLWYSVFKGSPLLLRSGIYMFGDWCSPVTGHSLRLFLNGYSVLDYLSGLITIDDETKNTALIMVNNTTHEGSFLQAPDYRPQTTVTNYGSGRFNKEVAYHINAASIKRLAEWFDLLKKENVFDNTRIILVSDHGPETNFVTQIGLPFNVDQFNPLLMFKDFNASGELKTDMAFMTNADVPYLALQDLAAEMKNPFTGQNISIDRKKDPVYIAISGSIHLGGRTDNQFVLDKNTDYLVHDNLFDAASWIPASKAESTTPP